MHEFISFLCTADVKTHIYELRKTATKKKPFSFERLCLMILPLVKYFEVTCKTEAELGRAFDSICKWIALVEADTNETINLNAKFEAILNIFLILDGSTVLKAHMFLQLVGFL